MGATYRYVLLLARRDRLLPALIFAVALVAALGAALGAVAVVEGRALALAFAAAAVRLVLALGAVALVLFGLRRLIDGDEVALMLSRPLARPRLLAALWAGYATVTLLPLPLAALALWLVGPPDAPGLTLWLASVGLEVGLLVAAALFFGLVLASPVVALLAVLGFYVLARSLGALLALAGSGGVAEPLLLALSALLPRLDLLGRGEWLIYGADIDGATALAFAQGLVYVPLLLAAAAIDLARREF